jgi:hypothetical protein
MHHGTLTPQIRLKQKRHGEVYPPLNHPSVSNHKAQRHGDDGDRPPGTGMLDRKPRDIVAAHSVDDQPGSLGNVLVVAVHQSAGDETAQDDSYAAGEEAAAYFQGVEAVGVREDGGDRGLDAEPEGVGAAGQPEGEEAVRVEDDAE